MDRLAVSMAEAAKALSVSPGTVRQMVDKGILPTVNTGSDRKVIPIAALEKLVDDALGQAHANHESVAGLRVVGGEARAGP